MFYDRDGTSKDFSGHTRIVVEGWGKSSNESVLEIMEQIAPILIKTMTTATNHVKKSLLTTEHDKIRTLEETIDNLEMEADKREHYSRRPNLRLQGIPEKTNERTNH